MNLGSISEKLPTYPSNIQGELRLILQTKDIFMVCYKQLEEYRKLVNEQNRLITKEFVQEQLQVGEDEITELKMELEEADGKLAARLRHNELLADQLSSQGLASLENGGSVRHMALIRSPQMRKQMMAQKKSNDDPSFSNVGRTQGHMIDNIALAIDEIHQEVRTKVKPLLDYYRDLFYLQLHFSLVLGQVCNYCMPLVTENIGLIERVFFWAERPEFELIRKASDISDRLKEIYTRSQQILGVLSESVRFLQSKVELQKSLENRFHERMDEQQKMKDKILRDVHGSKQNRDMLEEENDRLVGSLVKLDPAFVASQNFSDFAEGKKGSNQSAAPSNVQQNNQNNTYDYGENEKLRENSNEPSVNGEDGNQGYNNNKAASVICGKKKDAIRMKAHKKSKNCSKNHKIDRMNLTSNENESRDHHETRSRNREKRQQKKPERAATLVSRNRKGSNDTLYRDFYQRDRRSVSRRRSPSEGTLTARREKAAKSTKNRSSRDATSSEMKSIEASGCKNINEISVVSVGSKDAHSLKSRLLDRTKGLFDASKTRSKMKAIESSTDVSLFENYPVNTTRRIDKVISSISSVDSPYHENTETTPRTCKYSDRSKLIKNISKQSPGSEKRNKHNVSLKKHPKLTNLADEMLTLDESSSDVSQSNRRNLNSPNENRWKLKNDLADFLSSSASESLNSSDNSNLPEF